MSLQVTPEEFSVQFRNDSLQAALVECLFNGVYTSIFSFSLYRIISERGWAFLRRPLIILMVAIYLFTELHVAAHWSLIRKSFVSDGQTSESTLSSLLTGPTWIIVCGRVSLSAIMFLADCIMIWRCYTLWAHRWMVICVPVLLVLSELATSIMLIFIDTGLKGVSASFTVVRVPIANISLSLATTLLVTILIIYRIVSMGGGRRYHSVIEIVVESSALYAVALIIYMPFIMSPKFSDRIPNAVLAQVPGIASTLVIARVSFGLDRRDTTQIRGISLLRFNNTAPADEEAGTPSKREEAGIRQETGTVATRVSLNLTRRETSRNERERKYSSGSASHSGVTAIPLQSRSAAKCSDQDPDASSA